MVLCGRAEDAGGEDAVETELSAAAGFGVWAVDYDWGIKRRGEEVILAGVGWVYLCVGGHESMNADSNISIYFLLHDSLDFPH